MAYGTLMPIKGMRMQCEQQMQCALDAAQRQGASIKMHGGDAHHMQDLCLHHCQLVLHLPGIYHLGNDLDSSTPPNEQGHKLWTTHAQFITPKAKVLT